MAQRKRIGAARRRGAMDAAVARLRAYRGHATHRDKLDALLAYT